MGFAKQDYFEFMVKSIGLSGKEQVLEVAAGTCVCGRAIAPFAASVVCMDITPEMPEVGKEKAEKEKTSNISYKTGLAEDLPYSNEIFDVVITRLSFHHFSEIEQPFAEMKRVLKPCGKLIIIDMEAASDELRETEDKI